jgi:23S rRNA (uridine2552-2'-O)-methyltransferase
MSRKKRNPYARPDVHARKARALGYAARSVFKLEEIDKRTRLLKPGMRVLDLGAAPGSWAAYAAERVGKNGRVVAVDRTPITQLLPAHCITLEADVLDPALAQGPVGEHAPYDVVVSDMAPNTTGHRATDQLRSSELFLRALALATELLAPGGSFVGKIFMSGHFDEARTAVRARFAKTRTIRPEAVRDVSYEIFLVGLGFGEPKKEAGPHRQSSPTS